MKKQKIRISPVVLAIVGIAIVGIAVGSYLGVKMVFFNADSAEEKTILNPIPDGCREKFKISYSCWTTRFPKEITDRSDIACKFEVKCCGTAIQGWETHYPKAAGLRGVAGGDTYISPVSCDQEMYKLDIDMDGIKNTQDQNPIGEAEYPWE